MPSLHLTWEVCFTSLCCLKCITEDRFLAGHYCELLSRLLFRKGLDAVKQMDVQKWWHSCSVAKTKVSLVCAWKSVVLGYQSSGESTNHNRIWVRVTERDLSVFVWNVSKMEGISIEKTKNVILILGIFQILRQTSVNACVFYSYA